jgi:hypothetical protein
MNNKPVAYGMLTFCKNCGEQNPYAVKELTDDKIADLIKATNDEIGMKNIRTFDFTKVLLRKAQE